MNKDYYEMIFKRKSFHLFRNIGSERISDEELRGIEEAFDGFEPLVRDIRVRMKLVKEPAFCKRGEEYCILFYSEKKSNYLQNIGYLGEQMDLYLASRNIGALWFGIGKPEEKQWDGLDFVIMIAIAKVDSAEKFRKDMFKSKRKELAEIWSGEVLREIGDIARFAPSACNSQPWRVEAEEGALRVYRYRKPVRIGIMSPEKAVYFNQIDMGIFLCFLELCMGHEGIPFVRDLRVEQDEQHEKNLTAVYALKNT